MVAFASVASSKPKVELDSHAVTCNIGDNYLVINDHTLPVNITVMIQKMNIEVPRQLMPE